MLRSFHHLGAGLSVGLSGLAAGFAVGIVGDAGVRGTAQQPRLYVGMILILIFAAARIRSVTSRPFGEIKALPFRSELNYFLPLVFKAFTTRMPPQPRLEVKHTSDDLCN